VLNEDIEPLAESLYWRGIALDEFDGTTWRIGDADYRIYKNNKEGVIKVREKADKVFSQEIITEPLDTEILFAASLPVGFQGVSGGRLEEVNDSYILSSRGSYRLKYTAYSDLGAPYAKDLRVENENYPISIKRRYLKLPVLDGKIKALSNRITRLDSNAYDKAVSIRRYLAVNMNYTRTLKKGTNDFPIEDFLFQSKAGHCEYFATAMVVLLREIGVPARIVNGFHGGEWNEYGEFFLVRESNAHSWIEVFFPEHGWVLFDPTPAAESEFSSAQGSFFLSSYADYLRYRWNRYVVDFTQRDQVRILRGISNNWSWQKSRLQSEVDFKIGSPNKKWFIAFALLILVTWTIYTNSDLKRFLGLGRKKPDERASIIYKKGLSVLSKQGLRKSDFATPREFAQLVMGNRETQINTFHEFTERYLDLRFGGSYIKHELGELERLLDKIKKELK
ncbi:MAG: transglutaminase TgpA family protein, partial [Thermodesulfobacteriota bacterium]